jgi:P27 family predicted phage terminase small subunit
MSERKSLIDHALQGTKPAYDAGEVVKPGRPKYPKNISGRARWKFKQLVAQLQERDHITPGDEEILRIYAELFTSQERARKHIADEGEIVLANSVSKSGEVYEVLKPNQWLKVALDCESKMLMILTQLGLTPATRNKVKRAEEPKQVADEFPTREEATKPTGDPDADLLASIDENVVPN